MRRLITACLTAWILTPATAFAAEYVNDPLTSATFPGRGSKGGTFSSTGWTVVAEPDAFWYEIADALPSGRVEYTVTGISTAGSLTGADHDIFTMYQAPEGQAEPIAYSPYFRNNDFKTFTRIFGVQEPGRAGAMKLELAFCPRGAPWYHDSACTAQCDGSGIAYANGTDKDVGWDAATSYRMALEWGSGKITFFRDQAALGTVSYPGEFAPKPLRIRFGSPRHDGVYPGVAMMPLGITFRDVLVTGTPGAMTAVCEPATPDAGEPDATVQDAGTTPGEYTALADVTAASWETGVFPDVTDLNVEADASGNPIGVAYLRFPAVAGMVQHAVLRLHTSAGASAAGGSGVICPVADNTWSETTMTWATRPAVGSTCAGTPMSVDSDANVEWDVTALVASGASVNLAVVSKDSNGVHYMSKEAGDASKSPKLIVVTQPGGPDGGNGGSGPGGAGGAGGSSSAGAAGAPGKGGASGTAGNAGNGGMYNKGAGSAQDDDSGCGCRAAGRGASGYGVAVLAALALIRARRRKCRKA